MDREEIFSKIREVKKENSAGKQHNSSFSSSSTKAKYKIIYERDLCIGVAACVMSSPKYWEMDSEGKAMLKQGKEVSPGIFEIEISEEDYAESFEAAKECPVNCIHIINLETGEKII